MTPPRLPLRGSAGDISAQQIDAAATRALIVMFELGLFENPYVDSAEAGRYNPEDVAQPAGYRALNRSIALLVNEDKPAGS